MEIIPETKDKGKKLNLTRITMVRCNTIQENEGNYMMKGLLDSGGTHTMINKKCLKNGTTITPIVNAEHMAIGGNFWSLGTVWAGFREGFEVIKKKVFRAQTFPHDILLAITPFNANCS